MSNTGFKGIDVRQTGGELVFRAFLTASGAVLTAGTTNLNLYELQSNGALKTYDFSTNTFVTTTVTTLNQTMSQQAGNNGAQNTGIWTFSLSTLTGFTVGAMYFAQVLNSSADTPVQTREFLYGSEQGDLVVTANGAGIGELNVDVQFAKGNAVTTASNGILDVNAKNINNVSAAAVTTINANIGTTQLIMFDTNNYQKVDLVDIAGTAISTTAAQLGVNVVQYNAQAAQTDANNLPKVDLEDIRGTPSPAAAGYIGADWGHVNAPTTTVVLSGTTIGTITTYTGDTPQTGDSYAQVTNATYGLNALHTLIASLPAASGIATAVWSTVITGSVQAGSILTNLWTFLGSYAAAPTASVIAAAILKTPANLIATNSDNSVNADITISSGDITEIADGVVAQLGGATITLVSPLSSDGSQLLLTTGDSYTAANGQSFKFNITGQAALVGTIPHLRLNGVSSDFATAPAIVSGTQQIIFNDVLVTATANLTVGTYPYQIRFEDGLGNVATVIQGYAIVKAGI